jgi:predicted MarR family transcription regulator
LQAKNGTSVKSPFSKSLDRLKVMVNCVYEESAREQGTCNSSLPVTSKLEIVRRMEAQREELGLSAARYVDSYLRWHLRCLKTVDMPKPDKPDGLIRYLKEGAQRKAAKEAACAAVGLAGMSEAD